MINPARKVARALALSALLAVPGMARGSSHMDAPLITLDPAANTTDVYAFRSTANGTQYLTTALAVYPFEEPGIGPNRYNFDDTVRYEIHVALGDDLEAGRATLSYRFEFGTTFKREDTILQSFTNIIDQVDDAGQNLTQRYTVTQIDQRTGAERILGSGLLVPPNNQGIATPKYNQNDDGDLPAKAGVATAAELDAYTSSTIFQLDGGYLVFAGQRDDGFYADIQGIFDLLQLRDAGADADSQGGFNLHMVVLNIPLSELGGDQQSVGVYATTSRPRMSVVRTCLGDANDDRIVAIDELIIGVNNALQGCPDVPISFVQVGRQGNPLFNEGFVAIADKDLYSRTSPTRDRELFEQYALRPELARLLGADVTEDRTDIAQIFIPDLIKVDLSTGPARLAGAGENAPTNPDDDGFSRLGVFGGDTLISTIQPGLPLPGAPAGTIPGGWPNGRRFGDDVVDIAVSAALSDLRAAPLVINVGGDNVTANDITFSKVFPYAATPLNGRIHGHH